MLYLAQTRVPVSEAQIVHFHSAAYAYHGIMASFDTVYRITYRYADGKTILDMPNEERFEIFRAAWSMIEEGDTLRQIINTEPKLLGKVLKGAAQTLENDLSKCRKLRNKKAHYPQNIPQNLKKKIYEFPLGNIHWVYATHEQMEAGDATSTLISAEPMPPASGGARKGRGNLLQGITKNREAGKPMIVLACGDHHINLSNFAERLFAYSELIKPGFETAAAAVEEKGATVRGPISMVGILRTR